MALKNLMGLVCDPVAGLVEVPCVKRNVIGAGECRQRGGHGPGGH
jgi:L-serine deaminase